MDSAREILGQAHERFLRRDLDGVIDLVTDDVVIENPFAPEGFPRRIEGRENVRARLTERFAVSGVEFDRFDPVTVHETTDPEVIVVEFELHGRVPSLDRTFSRQYIQVLRVRDGKIAHWRDYFNPAQV
jgi:ketosteroid isomerase-like protein